MRACEAWLEMSGGGAVNSGRLGTGPSRGLATGFDGIRPNGWLAGAARTRGFHVFKCHPDGVYKRMDYIRNAVGSIELGRMDDSRIAFEEAHAMRSRVLKPNSKLPWYVVLAPSDDTYLYVVRRDFFSSIATD